MKTNEAPSRLSGLDKLMCYVINKGKLLVIENSCYVSIINGVVSFTKTYTIEKCQSYN